MTSVTLVQAEEQSARSYSYGRDSFITIVTLRTTFDLLANASFEWTFTSWILRYEMLEEKKSHRTFSNKCAGSRGFHRSCWQADEAQYAFYSFF